MQLRRTIATVSRGADQIRNMVVGKLVFNGKSILWGKGAGKGYRQFLRRTLGSLPEMGCGRKFVGEKEGKQVCGGKGGKTLSFPAIGLVVREGVL